MLRRVQKSPEPQVAARRSLPALHRRHSRGFVVVLAQSFDAREQELLWDLLFRSRIRIRSDILNTVKRHNEQLYVLCTAPFFVRFSARSDWLVGLHDHGNGTVVHGLPTGDHDGALQHGFPFSPLAEPQIPASNHGVSVAEKLLKDVVADCLTNAVDVSITVSIADVCSFFSLLLLQTQQPVGIRAIQKDLVLQIFQSQQILSEDHARYLLSLASSLSSPFASPLTRSSTALQLQVKQLLYRQVVAQYLQASQVFLAAQWELQLVRDCSLRQVRSLVAEYAFERLLAEPEGLVKDVRSVCALLAQSAELTNLDALSEFADLVEGFCVASDRRRSAAERSRRQQAARRLPAPRSTARRRAQVACVRPAVRR